MGEAGRLALAGADDLLFAQASRSPDGWRTYVHIQAGEGRAATLITWVFEDGQYLFRVVDRGCE